MNFARFLAAPLENFATTVRARNPLLVFQHIPKTAGTSLTQEMAMTFPPYKNIHITYTPETVATDDAMADAINAFLPEHPERRFRSASGHFNPPHVRMLRDAIPYASFFTVLRDPVARMVSHYRYSTSPAHPPYEAFLKDFPTIEHFVASPGHQNFMWKRVRGSELTTQALDQVMNRFLFIGLVEDLQLHFEVLSGLFGCPKIIATRANVTKSESAPKVEITPDLREWIEETNPADVAFYRAVKTRLDAKRGEMEDFVAQRRALFLGQNAAG